MSYDERHGGPFDRGSLDAYYHRKPAPHYYKGNTGVSEKVIKKDMTDEEISAYYAGFDQCEDFKEYN